MTNHERLTEQYEDALFALLMDSVADTRSRRTVQYDGT